MINTDGEDAEPSRELMKVKLRFLPKSEITRLVCAPA